MKICIQGHLEIAIKAKQQKTCSENSDPQFRSFWCGFVCAFLTEIPRSRWIWRSHTDEKKQVGETMNTLSYLYSHKQIRPRVLLTFQFLNLNFPILQFFPRSLRSYLYFPWCSHLPHSPFFLWTLALKKELHPPEVPHCNRQRTAISSNI